MKKVAWFMDKSRNYYEIAEDGSFVTYNSNKWEAPHDTWKCLGCYFETSNFGTADRCSLPTLIRMLKEGLPLYKNGKPKLYIVDLDNGTKRIWGSGLVAGGIL